MLNIHLLEFVLSLTYIYYILYSSHNVSASILYSSCHILSELSNISDFIMDDAYLSSTSPKTFVEVDILLLIYTLLLV